MSATQEVDPPLTNVELVPEKETIEDVKEPPPAFPCQLSDIELVYKIAQSFLPGLASACVDNTTGGIFRTPGSVAADLRTEMVNYLTQRSETFVAESVILVGDDPQSDGSPDNPFDIVSDFVDDFASSKRNFFSRVSGWLLSEKREDKIDDFVQEMDVNGFWPVDKRSTVAETLLKNVDLKYKFHCDEKFNTEEELSQHVGACGFRSTNCNNEGCDVMFSSKNVKDHDSICPFKIIPCEQNCSELIMRRDMDRHCITVCKMKLVACPFYTVGCQANVPNNTMDQHRNDEVRSHVLFTLLSIHKEATVEDLQPRVDQVLELSSGLAEARDVRSLTRRIKNIEAKLEPLEIKPRHKDEESSTENGEKPAEEPVANKAGEEVAAAAAAVSVSAKEPEGAAATTVNEEITRAVENAVKESTETSDKINEESTEAEQSVEPSAASKVSEQSDHATHDLEKKVAEAELTVIEEPAEISTNLGKELTEATNKHSEEESVELVEAAEELSESASAIQNINRGLSEATKMTEEEPAEDDSELKEPDETRKAVVNEPAEESVEEGTKEIPTESAEAATSIQNLDEELAEAAKLAIKEEPAEDDVSEVREPGEAMKAFVNVLTEAVENASEVKSPDDDADKESIKDARDESKEPTSTRDGAETESGEAAKKQSEDPAPAS